MDLTGLTDDQLLQLIQATAIEVKTRAVAIGYASNKCWQDAKEDLQAEVAREEQAKAHQAAELNNNLKATIAELMIGLPFWQPYQNSNFTIEKINKIGDIQIHIRFGKGRIIYYLTGSRWAPPNSVNAPNFSPEFLIYIKRFSRLVCDRYSGGVICQSDRQTYEVDTQLLQEYRQLCHQN
jgi:hypothetical protein